ncbi:proton-conducting membrane transporter [Halogeometricum borinquense]|uniref:Proton-conducting membrane transporter n=1 Tax=Halogeometricum borinquense TaxID=60847 RepID=A0A6C0UIP4_9EURY|nr:proton-conducting membrane transporter [Halogeometricum borinquense]QIB73709.1 proton-conducting membrane transporter [Halogeometricum borinquense]QIQ76934.1 proton-conducting membrane transporter [Halogeometricum borinquense]
MTTRPRLKLGSHLVPGLAAVALFVVMVAAFVTASFPEPQGFGGDVNITASIGYAMFNLGFGEVASESFLVAFEIIDIVLVAALVGAVMLARRETGDSARQVLADGGQRLKQTLTETRDDETEGEN